jgi:hypothetical protein
LEYVSRSNKRKDYEDNFDKYEKELRVPYYLLFYPDDQELTLYRLELRRYSTVRPNQQGRYPIQKVDIEVALLDGWVRFWYQGRLLPLPAELDRALDRARREAADARREAEREKQRRQELEREVAQLKAIVEQQQGRAGNGDKPKRR